MAPIPQDPSNETEEKIFEAAREVFHRQGYDGARMQEIADRAGINKAMLHYYYRSKDRLFEAVFRATAMRLMPAVLSTLEDDRPLLQKLDAFVHAYLDMVAANPHVPAFILQELRRNPEGLQQFVRTQAAPVFHALAAQIEAAVARGEIRPIAPAHLFANMLALCVFPFIARPLLEAVTGMEPAVYGVFLEARPQEVTRFLVNALAP